MEPATLTANALPAVELATPPEAPIPTAKIVAAISAKTEMVPAVDILELFTSATTRFPSPSPSNSLMEKAPPIATAPAAPCPALRPIPIATAPAPAMILAVFFACTSTSPWALIEEFSTVAVVSTSILFREPDPAPLAPIPLPDCLLDAADNAPETV